MAGIGFRLRKIMDAPSLANLLRAYGYAAIIGSGPLIMSIASLGAIALLLGALRDGEVFKLFFSSVTYIYCFSLIATGPVQLVLVRFGADCHYLGEKNKIFPFLLSSLALVTPIVSLLSLVFFVGFVPASIWFQLGASFLCMLISSIWLVSSYLTAMKNYHRVLICFAMGYTGSLAGGWGCSKYLGHDWVMFGFALGHMLLLISLLISLYLELEVKKIISVEFLASFKKYADLAIIGLLYNLGIWSDKILFWFLGPTRENISGLIYVMPIHDQAVYLGFLSIIPGMAVFLLRLETDFARHYERYYKQIQQKATLTTIHQNKVNMEKSLTAGLIKLIKIQGLTTLVLVLFTEQISSLINLGSLQEGVFRMILLGSFLLVLFLSCMTVLFYLDKRKDVLIACLIFFLFNTITTLFTIHLGEAYYGLGFALGAALAFFYTAARINRHLEQLEYNTFALQPIY